MKEGFNMIKRGTVTDYLALVKRSTKVTIISECTGTHYFRDIQVSKLFIYEDLLCREVTSFNVYVDDYNNVLVAITIDDYLDDSLPDLSHYWVKSR